VIYLSWIMKVNVSWATSSPTMN